MPPQVEVRKSAEKEVKKVEEVKRFERRRSIEKKKEKSPKVEEEPTVVEAKKVVKKKEEELVIVEEPQQQRRPVVSSPHSGFPAGLILRKYYEDKLILSCAVHFCRAHVQGFFICVDQEIKQDFQVSQWPKTVQSRPV